MDLLWATVFHWIQSGSGLVIRQVIWPLQSAKCELRSLMVHEATYVVQI